MNAIGGQEILFPALLPKAPYEVTNRWTEYGDGVFRLQDRRKNDYMLGPTHEEFFTMTVKGEYSSYKDFPLLLFQIQTKYRDEARPRAGHPAGAGVRDEGLVLVRPRRRRPRGRVPPPPRRLPAHLRHAGVRYVIVSAISGRWAAARQRSSWQKRNRRGHLRALHGIGVRRQCRGGTSPRCRSRCRSRVNPRPRFYDTPGTPTIATLVEWANTAVDPDGRRVGHAEERGAQAPSPRRRVGAAGDWRARRPRGRRKRSRPRSIRPRSRSSTTPIRQHPFLAKGYIGPKRCWRRVRYLVDPRVVDRHVMDHRGRRAGRHVIGLVAGLTSLPTARSRPPRSRRRSSPDGAGPLVSARGVEIGHIFQLGRKYADAFEADVLGDDGKPVRLTMGSYGIGVSRLVAVIAEQEHDELGLRWPLSVSPPTCTSSSPTRTTTLAPAPPSWPRRRTGWASRCCSTTGRPHPG